MSDKDVMHELLQKIRQAAIDLGRTPSRDEAIKLGISKSAVDKTFGGYSIFLEAAGLDPARARKVDNSIFEKSIEKHLDEYEPKDRISFLDVKLTHTIIIGDTHFPFIQEQKLKKVLEYIEFKKPKRVIQIGDLYDMLSHGKFPRSMNVYTPKEEMSEGRKGALKMWDAIRKASPKSECHQILGNHDIRPMRKIIEQYPEFEIFIDFEKWFKFDGVESHMDIREELILDGVAFIHGYRSKLGEHMEYMRRPCVTGHSHRGGVFFKNFGDAILWELNAGYLGDPESKALSYTAQKLTHWTHGLGELDQFGPRFVHL